MKLTKGQKVLIEVEIAESEPDAYGEIYVIPQRAKELDQQQTIRVLKKSVSVVTAELEMYKKLYRKALDCVDEVFQETFETKAMLPDFLLAGECKFEGVKKLAKAYIDLGDYHPHAVQS